MKSITINTEDGNLYCTVSGVGDPLLLLHGNEEDHQIFEHQFSHFSKHFQVVALDTRGHGRSDHGKGVLTFQKIARDILAVLRYFNLSAVNIIGFSDGGNLALYFGSHYPKKVIKLIVIGANYKVNGLKKDALAEVKREYVLLTVLGVFFLKAAKKRQIIDLMWHQLNLSSADLAAIESPTLIVAGENDVIEESHTKKIHKLIAKSELVIVPKASHFLMVEKYKEFNQFATKFLLNNSFSS
ncbi:alpha/beta fold hydrolase [Carnobacterium sp.]|uniref:alpha/beta fold hydrolase n=1 Tax=Carnobacterium sp. TaxID=48221 RepID=UPI00388E2A31